MRAGFTQGLGLNHSPKAHVIVLIQLRWDNMPDVRPALNLTPTPTLTLTLALALTLTLTLTLALTLTLTLTVTLTPSLTLTLTLTPILSRPLPRCASPA